MTGPWDCGTPPFWTLVFCSLSSFLLLLSLVNLVKAQFLQLKFYFNVNLDPFISAAQTLIFPFLRCKKIKATAWEEIKKERKKKALLLLKKDLSADWYYRLILAVCWSVCWFLYFTPFHTPLRCMKVKKYHPIYQNHWILASVSVLSMLH